MLSRLRQKNLHTWLPGYGRYLAQRALRPRYHGLRHVLVAVCDHYEPLWGKADEATGRARVDAWATGYPRLAAKFRDADGRGPRHSFFFPGEEYRPYFLDRLAELARAGHGELEYHLHHDGDTAATLARGQALFFGNCVLCHSNQHRSITPDLRRMQPGTHEAFRQIVLEGALLPAGMPRWDDVLSPADADAIHAWLIDRQVRTRRDELDKQAKGIPLDAPSLAILSNY